MDIFVVCLTLLLCIILWKVLYFVITQIRINKQCKKLPCVPGHWLFGNSLQIVKVQPLTYFSEPIKKPSDYMKLTRKLTEDGHKVYCVWIGPFPVCGATHPETIRDIIKSNEPKARGFGDGYRFLVDWIGEGILTCAGIKRDRNRKLLSPAFHFAKLKEYFSISNKVADTFLDNLEKARMSSPGKSVEIFRFVTRATLDTMLRSSMSYEGDVQKYGEENHWYNEAVQRMSYFMFNRMLHPLWYPDIVYSLTSEGRENRRLCKKLHQFTDDIIAKRRKTMKFEGDKKHLDFLDTLLQAKDEDGVGLTDKEIRDEVDTILFAGHDTTASAIGWSFHALGLYLNHQDNIYNEIVDVVKGRTTVQSDDVAKFPLLTNFVKEVLRYYSPVPLIARSHRHPYVVDGYQIPVGPRMDINIECVHHNSSAWCDPEVFNPERFTTISDKDRDRYSFVPFSAGTRNCIGQQFALDEIKVVLAKSLLRFKITTDPDHQTSAKCEAINNPSNGIKVFLEKRQ